MAGFGQLTHQTPSQALIAGFSQQPPAMQPYPQQPSAQGYFPQQYPAGFASPSMQFVPTASYMAACMNPMAGYGLGARPSMQGQMMAQQMAQQAQFGMLKQTPSQGAMSLARPSQQMAMIPNAAYMYGASPGMMPGMMYPQTRASIVFMPT